MHPVWIARQTRMKYSLNPYRRRRQPGHLCSTGLKNTNNLTSFDVTLVEAEYAAHNQSFWNCYSGACWSSTGLIDKQQDLTMSFVISRPLPPQTLWHCGDVKRKLLFCYSDLWTLEDHTIWQTLWNTTIALPWHFLAISTAAWAHAYVHVIIISVK